MWKGIFMRAIIIHTAKQHKTHQYNLFYFNFKVNCSDFNLNRWIFRYIRWNNRPSSLIHSVITVCKWFQVCRNVRAFVTIPIAGCSVPTAINIAKSKCLFPYNRSATKTQKYFYFYSRNSSPYPNQSPSAAIYSATRKRRAQNSNPCLLSVR